MIRNVILDWSGTLVDDLPAVWEATNHVFRQAGVPELTLDQFRAEFRLPFQLFYDRFVPQVSLAELENWFHRCFLEIHGQVRELPHARHFLEFCRARNLRTFILSTMREDHYQVLATRTGLGQYVDRPYLGVWDKRARIGDILRENRLEPGETLLIGDMEHDIETAHHGGVYSCAVLTGYNRLDQLRRSRPHLIVEHLGELVELLAEHELRIPLAAGGQGPAGPHPNHPVATVGALISDVQGNVLMIRTRKWSDLWGIPGGKIKYGEPARAALLREIKEETGLEVENVELVLVQDCIGSPEFYREAHFVLLNYTCRCVGSTAVRLNEEAVESRWVSPEQAWGLPLNHPTRVLLETVLPAQGRSSAATRVSVKPKAVP